jgi:hypothetical protein
VLGLDPLFIDDTRAILRFMANPTVVVSVVGIVSTAVVSVAGIGAQVLTGARARRHESQLAHENWLRDRKAKSYEDVAALLLSNLESADEARQWVEEHKPNLGIDVVLYGSQSVRDLLESYFDALDPDGDTGPEAVRIRGEIEDQVGAEMGARV